MPFFGVVLFTWALTAVRKQYLRKCVRHALISSPLTFQAHGWGPLFSIPNDITNGWSVGFAFCTTITASISGNATFAINMQDITRFAHDRHRAWQMQFLLPVCITLTELLGTVMAASAQVIYGQVQWNPLQVVLLWDNRAGK
jgi:nucleobase:cation symporter-1, NCS1 family